MQIDKYANNKIHKYGHLFLLVLIVCAVSFTVQQGVSAHGDEDDGHVHSSMGQGVQDLQDNLAKQEAIRAKIAELQRQAKTLQGDLAYLQERERLTYLEMETTESGIQETKSLLLALEDAADTLQIKVGTLNESSDRLRNAYYARVKSSYAASFSPALSVFLRSEDFYDSILTYAYLGKVREEDKRFLDQLRTTVNEYERRAEELNNLHIEQEEVQKQLEEKQQLLGQQSARLIQDQEARRHLIAITNNDEGEYQKQLAFLENERANIVRALSQSGTSLGRVVRGQRIARQGSTGCSTGPHIHYSVHRASDLASLPVCNYIGVAGGACGSYSPTSGGTVVDGVFHSPASSSNRLTQSYWSGHLALDVVSDDGWVYASDDGEAYLVQDDPGFAATCRSWGYPYNGIGYGIRVEHDNGLITSYWHIQP